MKLHLFDAGSGDGLLIESAGGRRVLVDGGKNQSSWTEHLEPTLARLHADGHALDAVYVSHIDADHIGGVLRLMRNLLAWKVVEAHADRADQVGTPEALRPPEIGGIWHNAFGDLITRNRGRIEQLLTATAPDLLASSVPELMAAGRAMADIAVSIPEALEVSQIADLGPVEIPKNDPAGGKLMMAGDTDPFPVGDLHFTVIGPTRSNLRELRQGWDNWLRDSDNRAKTRAIRAELRDRIESFAAGAAGPDPFDLSDWNGIPDLDGVTVPNTASLMFLVREGDQGPRLLLTGDSHHDLIYDNLADLGLLDDQGAIHVEVLKVPHHGSEHNVSERFVRHVTADHYVFCGNGGHNNPDPSVIDLYFRSRRGEGTERAVTAAGQDPTRPFSFWFSTNSGQISGPVSRANFERVEAQVAALVGSTTGFQAHFNQASTTTLTLP